MSQGFFNYSSLSSFAKDRYKDPVRSLEERKKPSFQEYLSKEDHAKRDALSRLLLLSYPVDILVFKAGEILNPYRSIRIHGRLFESYTDLGECRLSTAPNNDAILTELVHHSCISEHRRKSGYSEKDPSLYKQVIEKEKQGNIDFQYAYFSIGYLLSKETAFFFEGKKYKNLFNLAYYLLQNDKCEEYGTYFSHSSLRKVYGEISPEGKKANEFLHLCDKIEESETLLENYLKKRKS